MCTRFIGVKPANAVEGNAWICAPATDRDLEDIIASFRIYYSGSLFEYVLITDFRFLFLRHFFPNM